MNVSILPLQRKLHKLKLIPGEGTVLPESGSPTHVGGTIERKPRLALPIGEERLKPDSSDRRGNLWGKYDEKRDLSVVSKCLASRNVQITKEKS